MKIIKKSDNLYVKKNFFGFTKQTLEFGTFHSFNPKHYKDKYDDTIYNAIIRDESGIEFYTDRQHAAIKFFELPNYIFE